MFTIYPMAIYLHGPGEIARLCAAGLVASATLRVVATKLCVGMSTADIDRIVRDDTARRGGRPSQLGYKGFPAAVCTSVNEVVCHGIPSRSVRLREGDIVNVDVTTEFEGMHGDTSRRGGRRGA
jgi:methionyl aminopeptidase